MRPLAIAALVLGCAAGSAAAAEPAADFDPIGKLLERQAFASGQGPVRWTGGELRLSQRSAIRVTVGGPVVTPGGLPLNLERGEFRPEAYEVSLTRDWPAALAFGAGRFDVDLSPHAGLGVGNTGGSAEAGATLRLSPRDELAKQHLKDLGVKDGAKLGKGGRWYLFAAATGRAVGLNMLRTDRGWDRAGWTTDPTSALIGDAQLGVGWRKAGLQSSFGLVHREVMGQHMIFGQQTRDDTLVAFSVSLKPQE
jgi:hypothetical protein